MNKKEVIEIIENHEAKNEVLLTKAMLESMMSNNDPTKNEMVQAHSGALTALKMLKMEIKGEKKW